MIYKFTELKAEHFPKAGGKGGTLARMTQLGYPIPPGFVILPSAFSDNELKPEAWEQTQRQLAHMRQSHADLAFAVRSSSLSEDSGQASFAGEFETVLDIRTDAEIHAAIKTVRQSRYSQRVQRYSQIQGLSKNHEMAIIVQKLIPAVYSGVLFTVDPVNGNLAQMRSDFVPGLGDKLVSGEVNPQTFNFTRPQGQYSGPPELAHSAKKLYKLAVRLEKALGCPQDIEWAVANGKIYLLQSRPITTLRGHNPVSGEHNDSQTGKFLWANTNLAEAYPEVLTPLSDSLHRLWGEDYLPMRQVGGHLLSGTIGGRAYVNLSLQVSAFRPLFGGDTRKALASIASVWGRVPEGIEIPLLPFSKREWFFQIMPKVLQLMAAMLKNRSREIESFLAQNPAWCEQMHAQVQTADKSEMLIRLWEEEIKPRYCYATFLVSVSNSDAQIRLARKLEDLVDPQDANILLSNHSGLATRLESLGPVIGLSQVVRGEISQDTYLQTYGHRGVNELEVAWPRPSEDPVWICQQLDKFKLSQIDVESLLAQQTERFETTWERFCQQHSGQAKKVRAALEKVARQTQHREAVRSEMVRIVGVVRAFVRKAGDLTTLGEDIFYLTIEDLLTSLQGDPTAQAFIQARKETFARYRELPPYPTVIIGRFDPFKWAADPQRRSDLYHADSSEQYSPADASLIRGFAGAFGVVEGIVRRLTSLDESDQLLPGEILVTTSTNIGWTLVFPRAAAIITDLGATLTHAAIVARELGIPAVVGCGDATMRLQTGDRVRVDGCRGLVEILAK